MSNLTPQQTLANDILLAMYVREDSYDHKMTNELHKQPFPDFSKCYKKSIEEACKEASPEFAELLSPMLYMMWNDAHEWAIKNKA